MVQTNRTGAETRRLTTSIGEATDGRQDRTPHRPTAATGRPPIPRRSPDAGPVRALAGVAIVIVMAHGLGLPVGGGHLALDALFVILGYQLVGRIPRPAHDPLWLKRFWVTSAARLGVPVLVAVGLATLYWWRLDLLDEAAQRAVLGAITFTANFAPAFGASLDAVDHLWALALVAQFAVLAPLLMVAGSNRLGAGRRASTVLGLAAGVALCRILFLATDATGIDMISSNPLTRLDGMLVGAAVALAPAPLLKRCVVDGYPLAAFAGLALLVVVAPTPTEQPVASLGILSAAAVALTALPLASLALGRPIEGLTFITGNHTLQWLGSRAVGIYVWYRIFGVTLTTTEPETGWPGAAMFVIQAVFTLAAASTSYRYIEVPARAAASRMVDRQASLDQPRRPSAGRLSNSR